MVDCNIVQGMEVLDQRLIPLSHKEIVSLYVSNGRTWCVCILYSNHTVVRRDICVITISRNQLVKIS